MTTEAINLTKEAQDNLVKQLFAKYSAYPKNYIDKDEQDKYGCLVDALCAGLALPCLIRTFKTWTAEIDQDVQFMIQLIPEAVNFAHGKARCREATPLYFACCNENVGLHIIEMLLQRCNTTTLRVNDEDKEILDDLLQNHLLQNHLLQNHLLQNHLLQNHLLQNHLLQNHKLLNSGEDESRRMQDIETLFAKYAKYWKQHHGDFLLDQRATRLAHVRLVESNLGPKVTTHTHTHFVIDLTVATCRLSSATCTELLQYVSDLYNENKKPKKL